MAQCKLSPTWKWLPHQFLIAFSYVFVFLSVLWSASHLLQFVARLENWPFFLQLVSPCPLLPWDQKPTKHHIIPTHLSVLAYSNLYHLTLTASVSRSVWMRWSYPKTLPIFLTSTVPLHMSLSSFSRAGLCPRHSCHTWVVSNKIRSCIFQSYINMDHIAITCHNNNNICDSSHHC